MFFLLGVSVARSELAPPWLTPIGLRCKRVAPQNVRPDLEL